MFKILIFMTFFIFIGYGEASSYNKTPKEQIAALENEGGLPKLDRSADIAGPDENANSIRDDIEAYIVQHYPDEQQKKALFQDAKAMRNALIVDTSDMIAVKAVGIQMSQSTHCLFLRLNSKDKSNQNPHIASRQMEAMATNTKPRLQAYLKFNHTLDGTTWTLPEGDTCE
jgi:hypothetical protein